MYSFSACLLNQSSSCLQALDWLPQSVYPKTQMIISAFKNIFPLLNAFKCIIIPQVTNSMQKKSNGLFQRFQVSRINSHQTCIPFLQKLYLNSHFRVMSCPWGWILGLDIHIHPQDHINTSVRFREIRHLGTRGTSERLSIYDQVASRVSSSSGSLSPALQLPAHCTLLTTELLLYLNTGTGTSIVVA